MKEPTRFVVAGTQRTGTTLLRTCLSSHPDIVCHGEVFKLGKSPYTLPGGYWAFSRQDALHRLRAVLRPEHSVRDFLSQLFSVQDCSAAGFKIMLSQCRSSPYLWPLVTGHGVRTILVTRRNVLKTLVSRRAAAATGVYHVSSSLPVKSAVANWVARPASIDPETLIDDLDKILNETVEWKRRLKDCEFIEFIYEEYVQDRSYWNAKALDFLGVSRRSLNSDLKKVNPDELRGLVSNYDEIVDVVRKSRYSFCLGSEG